MTNSNPIRIAITGPESTGKTELSKSLSNHYKAVWIPEFARDYINKLNSNYTYNDVVIIAKRQIEQYKQSQTQSKFIFFDTWLIITKIWFKEVYGKHPNWLDESLREYPIDLFLVCNTDIEWVFDSVRENEDSRDYLLHQYIKEIENLNIPYRLISGKDDKRRQNAIEAIEAFLLTPN